MKSKDDKKILFYNFQTNESNRGEIGPIALIIHGTEVTPAHMKNGPRRYNNRYNGYSQPQQFDYLDSGGSYNENAAPFIPEQHNTEEFKFNSMLLDEMEKELLRNHHSKYFVASVET